MNLIMKKRGMGKTTDLIRLSNYTGFPIVAREPRYVKEKAEQMNIDIPEPISWKSFKSENSSEKEVLIDELSLFLRYCLGINCVAATETMNDMP